jgi:hypothetical protein
MGIEYLGRGGEKHRAPSEGAYAFQPRFVPGNKIEDHDPGRPTEPTERFSCNSAQRRELERNSSRLAAIAQGQLEKSGAPVLAAVQVTDHRPGAVIDLGLFIMERVP